ncbi:bifunctional phosphoribosylaminoimidazolecarboxamide formyltransferase/IMP cyclohydrolase [Ignavibacteria bacterium]|nr:bifunctional phosphoribosylaminoimidazolecarboxamide formyltransferase/IMP cyclohydrolase [Bacteroidota bacterium]MCZ2132579.1 bifunctional phosphoribosylaminoimidazolecarboxamide formyltransferase/IMP cyclohydrolase [Bacteroidota bacterium]
MTPDKYMIKTAIISVSDKTGIAEFAAELHRRQINIISTGGTAALLENAGIPVRRVSDLTGFPEIMDGRVKTLHPSIHGGLLGILDNDEHRAQMSIHGINSIDLAVINLYPFEKTVVSENATDEEIIENIDIGGPAMIRASAKNYRWTVIAVNVARYGDILKQLDENNGCISEDLRRNLAAEAFAHTARYDALIAKYFQEELSDFPDNLSMPFRKQQSLRYGENPHQSAALYGDYGKIYRQLHGKELSYNNILDIDAAAKCALEFAGQTAVVIVKHTNPCGVAVGYSLGDAFEKAMQTDKVSPFGGILAFTREVDAEFAESVHSMFTEVLIAPSFTDSALNLLRKKKDRRLIAIDYDALKNGQSFVFRSVAGGMLMQSDDTELLPKGGLRVVTKRAPNAEEYDAMTFAWKIAKHIKSNAIVYAHSDRTLAIGAGQTSRIDSARIARDKAEDAGLDLKGCAVASDAFFPFADGLLQTIQAGATAVIQPGGSVRDEEVIAAADEHNIAMIFTGMRHFRH